MPDGDSGCDRPAPCGFGYDGMCCCTCALHLLAKPRCHHLGGSRICGDGRPVLGPDGYGGLSALEKLAYYEACDEADARFLETARYVCLAFASEGIAQTDWDLHGCCEMWTEKTDD